MKPMSRNQIAPVLGEPFGLSGAQVLDVLVGGKPIYWAGAPLENDSSAIVHTGKPAKTPKKPKIYDLDRFFPLPTLDPSGQ
jgi:hypothetical protein